jgi:hypothetical protein
MARFSILTDSQWAGVRPLFPSSVGSRSRVPGRSWGHDLWTWCRVAGTSGGDPAQYLKDVEKAGILDRAAPED